MSEPFAVLLLVKLFGADDPLVPFDAIGSGVELVRNLLQRGRIPLCDLLEGHDAQLVEHPFERRSDAADLFEVVFWLRR